MSDGTRTRDRLDHEQGVASSNWPLNTRLGSGIRTARAGRAFAHIPGRYRAIPAGFGPSSRSWAKREAFAACDQLRCLTAHNEWQTLARMRQGFFICVVAAVLTAALVPTAPAESRHTGEVATSAACNSVRYEGRTYVLYRRAVGCRSARRKVRYVHRHKRLPGWRCQSGSNFETGGGCTRGRKLFGWHPFD